MTDKLKVVAAIAWANIGKEEGEVYSVTLDRQPYHDTPLVKLSDLNAALERVKVLEADARRLDVLEAAPQRDGWIVAKNVGSFTVHLGKGQHATRATLREAIDATSMAGKGTTE